MDVSPAIRAAEDALLSVYRDRVATTSFAASAARQAAEDTNARVDLAQRALLDAQAALSLLSRAVFAAAPPSPLQSMPKEVLAKVFMLAMDTRTCAFTFAAVCSHWRKVALKVGRLWRDILIDASIGGNVDGYLTMILERSSDSPLDVELRGVYLWDKPLFSESLLVELLGRSRTLTLEVGAKKSDNYEYDDKGVPFDKSILKFFKMPMPMLEKLIESCLYVNLDNHPSILALAPKLTEIRLSQYSSGLLLPAALPHLVCFEFGYISHVDLVEISRSWPHLKKLSVRLYPCGDDVSGRDMALPELEELDCVGESDDGTRGGVLSLLSAEYVPKLRVLELPARGIPELGAFFGDNPYSSLERLTILGHVEGDWQSVLAMLPRLEYLKFMAFWHELLFTALEKMLTAGGPALLFSPALRTLAFTDCKFENDLAQILLEVLDRRAKWIVTHSLNIPPLEVLEISRRDYKLKTSFPTWFIPRFEQLVSKGVLINLGDV